MFEKEDDVETLFSMLVALGTLVHFISFHFKFISSMDEAHLFYLLSLRARKRPRSLCQGLLWLTPIHLSLSLSLSHTHTRHNHRCTLTERPQTSQWACSCRLGRTSMPLVPNPKFPSAHGTSWRCCNGEGRPMCT